MHFFATFIVTRLLHIDICYSSISAKSTLVDVVQRSGGERCRALLRSSLRPLLLTIDLTPNYVLFLHSFYYQPDAY